MNNKKHLIPKFKTDKEAATFFDNNETTDFIAETVKTKASFPHPTHKIVISLDDNEWKILRRKATLTKVPYSRLLKKIIHSQLTTA